MVVMEPEALEIFKGIDRVCGMNAKNPIVFAKYQCG